MIGSWTFVLVAKSHPGKLFVDGTVAHPCDVLMPVLSWGTMKASVRLGQSHAVAQYITKVARDRRLHCEERVAAWRPE